MKRIPEEEKKRQRAEELERLKAEIDLVALIQAKGIELKKHGAKDLVGHCPFHNDKTPSLVVSPEKNLWHCLGACQTGGSVIDWVMKAEKVSLRHAIDWLRMGKGRPAPRPDGLNYLAQPVVVPGSGADEVMRQVLVYYHDTLKERAPEALSYLEARGIRSDEAIEQFHLGYCNRTLGFRIPERATVIGTEIRDRLMETGLFRESGHEFFVGSVVFPVVDEEGRFVEIYGRKINQSLKPPVDYHSYLPGPMRGVWNLPGVKECGGDLILCEAIIDALSFWVQGFKNVTASYGVQGFTKDHWAAFKKYGIKRVWIAYDRDEAGDRAAEKLAKKLLDEGIESLRVLFPKGMDANDFINKVKPADDALKVALQSAEFIGKLKTRPAPPAPKVEPEERDSFPLAALPEAAPAIVDSTEAIPEEKTPEQAAVAAAELLEVPTRMQGEDIFLSLGAREYRVRGLRKNLQAELMRVNVRVSSGSQVHVDTIDLYQAKARTAYVHAAAKETGVQEETLKRDLGRVLLKLEELQEAEIKKQEEHQPKAKKAVVLSEHEKNEALALLQSPNLLDQILSDFAACGVVGEEVNKLVGYLAAVSRKLEDPLAIILQSSSSSGKSSLMEAVLATVPPEDQVKYSAMTGQSLFYLGEKDLKHKILAIAEEQGAHQAAYALKLLQSEGEISIASTGKDPQSGKLVTHHYRVEGPVMIFLTTTAIEIDEELLNRCLVLTVNESREQTQAIHRLQRRAQTLEGMLIKQEKSHLLKVHQNAQRMLRPLLVANPFAEKLTFLDSRTRTRRDHMKYLALIRTIALLHQYQRPVKQITHRGKELEYVEVQAKDIEIANRLCHQVLGRSLDELPPQTRRLLSLLVEMVVERCRKQQIGRQDYRFTRREVREHTGWSDFQVQVHMQKLASLEYVLVHRGGRGQSFVYELLYEKRASEGKEPVLMGLIDPSELTRSFEHQTGGIEGSSSPQQAPIEGGCRSSETQSSRHSPAKTGENR